MLKQCEHKICPDESTKVQKRCIYLASHKRGRKKMALAFVLAAIILAFGPCPASFLASEGATGVATVGAAASGTGTCSYDAHHEKL